MLNERARYRLHHPIGLVPPLVEAPPGVPEIALAARVIAAWQMGPQKVAAGPVWNALLTGKQGNLRRWLDEGDAEALAHDLAGLGCSLAAQGFFGGLDQHRKCQADPAFANQLAVWTYDKLLSLAEAVGVVRLELPETGDWGRSNHLAPEMLFGAIEKTLDVDLSPPGHIGGYLGIAAGSRVIQMRIVEAIYAAWRLRQIAERHGSARICEIGAGAGLTAWYARKLGLENYHIIDLPTMNAVQGYVLGPIGADMVLHGERREGIALRVAPHSAFAELAEGSIDILYNQDSFPEIEPEAARAYLRDAQRLRIPLLLSINQEAHLPTSSGQQESVPELIAATGGYSLVNRHRHWLRQGYVEELYELPDGHGAPA